MSWEYWKLLLAFSIVLVTVIAFSGCGGPKNPGKYLPADGKPGRLTIYKDGSWYLEGKTQLYGQVTLSGTWKQHENDVILTSTGPMGQRSMRLVVKEDGVLVDPDGYKWIREDKFKQVLTSGIQEDPPKK